MIKKIAGQTALKSLSLYVHIPFCIRKCAYCDFLSFSAEDELKKEYIRKLKCEIINAAEKYKDRTVISVFFGGGTPSVLNATVIKEIVDIIRSGFTLEDEAEISLEANPGTIDREKLKVWKCAGINRLSIGCQSFDDKELKILGRIHTVSDIYECYDAARETGFDNINMDIMSALPGQTSGAYEYSLKMITDLKPEHISAYSLIVEEGTVFYDKYGKDLDVRNKGGRPEVLPDEEEERRMLYRGREILIEAGYKQYEISNYSLPGYECRHNKVYWQRGDYAGFGLGAASCVNDVRWKNPDDIGEYLSAESEGMIRDMQKLSREEQRSEAMFLGLRLTRGVDTVQFEKRYGVSPLQIYGAWINKMLDEGLMEMDGSRLLLTYKGQDLANYVWGGFV